QAEVQLHFLRPLAGAEVDAEAVAARAVAEQAGILQRQAGGRGGEPARRAGVRPKLRLADVAAEVEVLHLRGEARREGGGVEVRDRPDAAATLQLGAEQLLDHIAQRGDHAHAGDDDAPHATTPTASAPSPRTAPGRCPWS